MHPLFYTSRKLSKFSKSSLLLASHLVIVYKLHKLKGLVLTQAFLFLITVLRYNVRLQVNRKCVSHIRNNMNYKGLPLRF